MTTGSALLYGPTQPRALTEPVQPFLFAYPPRWARFQTDDGTIRVLVVSSRFPFDITHVTGAMKEVHGETIPALLRWKELLSRLDFAYRCHWETGIVDFSFDLAAIERAARGMQANESSHRVGAQLARELLGLLRPDAEESYSRLKDLRESLRRRGT